MEYTVQQLARLAGVSARTLRYYDEIGLLKPARINSSGYRIYGTKEVDRLQQILFYRELGVSLEKIIAILSSPSFDRVQALKEHLRSFWKNGPNWICSWPTWRRPLRLAEGELK